MVNKTESRKLALASIIVSLVTLVLMAVNFGWFG